MNFDRIIYFDVCAVIILTIIFFSMFFRKMTKGASNISFIVLTFVSILTAITDLLCSLYLTVWPITQENYTFRYILHCLYFILRNLSTPMYLVYIISISSSWYLFKKNIFRKLVLFVPFLVLVLLVVTNNYTNLIFIFDENMLYQRGPGIGLLYLISGIYMLYGISYLVKYWKLLTRNQFIALLCMFPINLAAIGLQLLYPSLLIEMFATSIALLVIVISIQAPEKLIDQESGVFNQKVYLAEMQRIFRMGKKVNIIFVGIQNFKDFQSILTYSSLSSMVKQIGTQLEQIKKENRYGSDVFYLKNGLFAYISYEDNMSFTKKVASDIHEYMMKSIKIKQIEMKMRPRICYFRCPEDIDNYDSLVSFGKSYQDLLPDSKTAVDVSEVNFKKDLHLRSDLNNIVYDAIINRKFQIYYQPIYSVKEKRFTSAEALIRLKHEKYGFISPELFITAAEKNGTILQIGDFIFDEVCRFISSEEFKQLRLDYIEINLSVAQCLEADLTDKIKGHLSNHDIAPTKINLEITERESIKDYFVFDNNMKKLVDMGISFSLDDYGTGYSNIRRIALMPLKIVKMDKAFVDEISSAKMQSIVINTIRMLKEINKEIVVEGVEDAETARRFADLDCDYLQGYFFSRPLPETDFIEVVKKQEVNPF